MSRINALKNSRVDNFVPNKHVKASARTKPITVSQPYVITKKDVNSNTNGLSSSEVESTAKTRRPQTRSNPKNDRITSTSKSTCLSNNLERVEKHHRNLLLSKTSNHRSSECNNIKLAIRNDKSEVVCATLQMKEHKANVKKSNKLESEERLASPRPSKPRTCLRKKGRREKTRSDRIFGKRKSDFEMDGPVFIGDKKVAVAGGGLGRTYKGATTRLLSLFCPFVVKDVSVMEPSILGEKF
ncbi:hypothetical protein Tco_0940356 [Tanacetum coccineum]|uniref:Uncharacterized protein n=1 Tax=Tanacetum coccineum TaxID=301880 RepID=A0ABQ5DMS5_9ASTR